MAIMLHEKVLNYYGLVPTEGNIGIEIELEGEFCPFPIAPAGWRSEIDNSLKAEYNIEYVTNGPIPKSDVGAALDRMRKRLNNSDVKIVNSIRTGVHVHINCQENTFKQVFGFALSYFAMEKVLTNFCGPQRVGNQFCLRASDAEFLLDKLEETISTDYPAKLKHTTLRYSALNFCALSKFGSLEFRAMQTRDNLEGLEEWIDILWKVKKYGENLNTYSQIAEEVSQKGPEVWLSDIVGMENFNKLNYPGLGADIMDDLRNIQHLLWMGEEL